MPEWEPAPPSCALRYQATRLEQIAAALRKIADEVDALERMKEPKP